jgi:hypothetical protein
MFQVRTSVIIVLTTARRTTHLDLGAFGQRLQTLSTANCYC